MGDGMQARVIRIAAAVMMDEAGRVLLVRKRGTSAFMQPGGKIEPDEGPLAALARELAEELGVGFDPGRARLLGEFSAPAANEPGHVVEAVLYRVAVSARPEPAAEIEEIAWVDPARPPGVELAPLTRDHVLPLVRT
jgi:8-oxo-dGTP pyrophosphatase MutT (NUDIX family)